MDHTWAHIGADKQKKHSHPLLHIQGTRAQKPTCYHPISPASHECGPYQVRTGNDLSKLYRCHGRPRHSLIPTDSVCSSKTMFGEFRLSHSQHGRAAVDGILCGNLVRLLFLIIAIVSDYIIFFHPCQVFFENCPHCACCAVGAGAIQLKAQPRFLRMKNQ